MSVIKVNNRNMIHSSSPNKCITRTKMRVLIHFPNTAQILSGGSSVALVEVMSSLSPSSGQVVKLPLCPDHISSPCHSDLQQSVSHSSSSGRSQPRGVSLSWFSSVPPGWHAHPFKAPAAVASFSPGVDGLCAAGLPSGPGSTFQALVHSASFIQSARHGGGLPQPLSHFHGQPWN